jgi:transcriptional regulator with XRE-family HTH domain
MLKRNRFIEFGQEVRRRRYAVGMTLDELARLSGLTPNYLGTIEAGRRDPSFTTMLAIAGGLGAHLAEMLGSVPELSPGAKEAAWHFQESTPEVQSAVLRLLRVYARWSTRKPRR